MRRQLHIILDVIKTIRKKGMEPLISLEHWDLPAVLIERFNGWAGEKRWTATSSM